MDDFNSYQSNNYYGDYVEDGEALDDPTLTMGRRNTVFLVDVSKVMFERDENGEYYAKQALTQLRDYLNSMALSANMSDRISIMFLNVPPSAENAYNGYSVYYPQKNLENTVMDSVSAPLVQEINALIDAEDTREAFAKKFNGEPHVPSVDLPEIFHECSRLFNLDKAMSRNIVIYSRNYPLTTERKLLEKQEKRMSTLESTIHISVCLVDFPLGQTPHEYWQMIDPGYEHRLFKPGPDKIFVETTIRSTSKLPFLLGKGLEIPVSAFTLIRERVPTAPVKLDSETNEVVERTAFFARIDDAAQLDNEEATNGENVPERLQLDQATLFRKTEIGGREIVLSTSDFENFRRIEPKGIRLIGFKKMETLKDAYRVKAGTYLFPIEEAVTNSTKLYTALYKECLRKNVYALCRITFRSNMSPKLCALVPQERAPIDGEQPPYANSLYDGFHVIELPSMQDIRNLKEETDNEDRRLVDKDTPVSSAVSSLVDKLTADYIPEKFVNPLIQGHYRMIESVALKYDMDECIQKLKQCEASRQAFYQNPGLRAEVADELEEIGQLIASSDPNEETLARNRKRGKAASSNTQAKRGRTQTQA